jgi:uncharacterized damage-inducible protein DinB
VAGPPASRKGKFLEVLQREIERTRSVLVAFPPGSETFQPHPASPMARDVAWKIALGETLMVKAVTTGFDWSKRSSASPPKSPETFAEIVQGIETYHARVVEALAGVDDAAFDATVPFPVGPGKMGDWKTIDFLWFLLFDHIHHRGQLSVLLRMTGGRVPAIYGPSGDVPFF